MANEEDLPSIRFLRNRGCQFRIIHLSEIPRTADDVSRIYNCPLESVVKSVVFISGDDTVIAIVPGNERIDSEKLSDVTGSSGLTIAPKAEVEPRTGYPVGGVSPFGLPENVKKVIDTKVLELDVINTGSGIAEIGIEISGTEMKKIWDGDIVDIIQ